MHFKPGDIVVKRRSKAANLKNKVFKVIGPEGTGGYRVVNPFSKQKRLYGWDMELLSMHVGAANDKVRSLEQDRVRAQNEAYKLEREVRYVAGYFPTI